MKNKKDKKHWIGRTGPKVKDNIAPKRFHPRRKYCEAPEEEEEMKREKDEWRSR